MKLYHYSDRQYAELLTRRAQGADEGELEIATSKAKKMGLPLPYHDHVSLFFEPIPKEEIASTFPYGHPFWKAGNVIYEHVIDLINIEETSFWHVVESIEQVKFSEQFNWNGISDLATRSKWFTSIHQNDAKMNLSGYDTRLIYKAYRSVMVLSMLDFYRRAMSMRSPENTQYAAYVPHLMLYPNSGRIRVTSSRKVTLGNKKADPILFHLSFRKLPSTLLPRQPEDSGGDETVYTEQLPARVSFSPTIQQAFCAIYPNISRFFEVEGAKSITMNVYSPVECAVLPQIDPNTVVEKVWDAHYTGEVCYTAPVKVVLVGRVVIINPNLGKQVHQDAYIRPFNNPMLPEKYVCPIVNMKLYPKDRSSVMF